MAMPQRDDTIEAIKRLDLLLVSKWGQTPAEYESRAPDMV